MPTLLKKLDISLYRLRLLEADLLNLGCRRPEKLDVSRAHDLFVLLERLLRVKLLRKQDESVTRGSSVWFPDEQDSGLFLEDLAAVVALREEIDLSKDEVRS